MRLNNGYGVVGVLPPCKRCPTDGTHMFTVVPHYGIVYIAALGYLGRIDAGDLAKDPEFQVKFH